jgi:formate hydrogenlyase transcriptional activator
VSADKSYLYEVLFELSRSISGHDGLGNIRELQNIIERSVILPRGRTLELAMPEMAASHPMSISRSTAGFIAERERILQALKNTRGVVSGPNGAARRLGLKRTALQARMKKLGISRDYQWNR